MARLLTITPTEGSSYYGEVFEHFIITEIMKLASYYQPEYRFSYLKTKDDAEIDLVVDRPGEKLLLIEIKSASHITKESINKFSLLAQDLGQNEAVCFANCRARKTYDNVTVYPWQQGIKKYFLQN